MLLLLILLLQSHCCIRIRTSCNSRDSRNEANTDSKNDDRNDDAVLLLGVATGASLGDTVESTRDPSSLVLLLSLLLLLLLFVGVVDVVVEGSTTMATPSNRM